MDTEVNGSPQRGDPKPCERRTLIVAEAGPPGRLGRMPTSRCPDGDQDKHQGSDQTTPILLIFNSKDLNLDSKDVDLDSKDLNLDL